ncbi:hypothetical protein [Gemmatimonas sp.]|jgi:hypothetical protein|uniref:hypothetical protein n=1 Tax=Gemmatimonas sp. TaxID=1962908 RepID=UPI0037BE6EF7
MAHATAKDLLKEAADRLPDDASVEEVMERVLFLAKIEQGRTDEAAGRTVSHEDAKRRLGL